MNTNTLKPCRKCGAADRTPYGHCRPCNRAAYEQRKSRTDPCSKCGSTDRTHSGQCRPCQKRHNDAYLAERKANPDRPCPDCGEPIGSSGSYCGPCQRERAQQRAEANNAAGVVCDRCGNSEWNQSGQCAPCYDAAVAARAKHRIDNEEPCGRCSYVDWNEVGSCRECHRRDASRRASRPCITCGLTERYESNGQCIPCHSVNMRASARKRLLEQPTCEGCGQVAWRGEWATCRVCDGVRAATRRTREANAEGFHTPADIRFQYKLQKGRCHWCFKPVGDAYHVDHVIPLARGGSNGPENLVISCPRCNMSKGAKLPTEFAGRLF